MSIPVRCVLLGASNVTIGFPLIMEALRKVLPDGSEVFAAHGHGRSYLRWSSVLHRSLPGIVECQLWEDLDNRPAAEKTVALITDVGNDILYGESSEPLLASVRECLRRLQRHEAKTVCVRLPISRVSRLTARSYWIVKNLFFPGPTRPWSDVLDTAKSVDAGLLRLSAEFQAATVEPPAEWYGLDPIHIQKSQRPDAWQRIFDHWGLVERWPFAPVPQHTSIRWWRIRPHERRIFRTSQAHPQPVLAQREGVSLWLY